MYILREWMQESKFYRTSIELLNNTLCKDKDGLLYAFIVIEYVRIRPCKLPMWMVKRFFALSAHTHRMTCNVLRFWQIPASFQMFSSFQKKHPLLHSDTKISAGMPHSWNTRDGSVSKCPMHEWIVENLSIFRTIRCARIKMDFYTHSSSMHTYGFILANCR